MIKTASTTIALLGTTLAFGQAPTTKDVGQPPAYTPVRWNENYTYLKTAPAKDLFDPIKHISLGDDIYLSLGGQVRERYERWSNFNLGTGIQDANGFFLHRAFLHADLHVTDTFRLFAQIKSSLEDGRDGGPRAVDADEIDIEQLFFDIKVPLPLGPKDAATLRVGRQNLIYGAQRLISPLDWTNVRRTFEGVKLSTQISDHTLDAFWVRPVIVNKEQLNDGDGDQSFAGIYDTIALPTVFDKAAATKLELYFLALNQQANAARPADADTYTIGARFSSAPKPWDIDAEVDYQFGSSGAGDIAAYSLALEGGYTFVNCEFTPRLYLGFDYASGDDDLTDPDKQTFNQLFPLGHAYFGYADVIGRQNIIDIHPGVQFTLLKDKDYAKLVKLRADYHLFMRASTDDALYGVTGAVQRADTGSDSSDVGSEIDVLLDWQYDRHLSFYAGYSHFFAGDFFEETGSHDDIDFVYIAASYTF
ncbi:MAG: alginate export family protein [Burkholderiales bacterium]|nr:alginate export family protein [Phycisphaerae bacterium]